MIPDSLVVVGYKGENKGRVQDLVSTGDLNQVNM